MAKVTEVAKTKEKKPKASYPVSLSGILWKIGVLGLVDAIVFFMIMVMLAQERFVESGVTIAVALIINWIYLRRGGLPAKYLAPGVLFLIIFQVYVLVFSGYTAFTNYGSAHNGDQNLAIQTIENAAFRVVDGEDFVAVPGTDNKDGQPALLLTSNVDGKVYLGKDGKEKIEIPEGKYTLGEGCADPYDEDIENCARAAVKASGFTAVTVSEISPFLSKKYLSLRIVLDPGLKEMSSSLQITGITTLMETSRR
jgi:hypothetical protein